MFCSRAALRHTGKCTVTLEYSCIDRLDQYVRSMLRDSWWEISACFTHCYTFPHCHSGKNILSLWFSFLNKHCNLASKSVLITWTTNLEANKCAVIDVVEMCTDISESITLLSVHGQSVFFSQKGAQKNQGKYGQRKAPFLWTANVVHWVVFTERKPTSVGDMLPSKTIKVRKSFILWLYLDRKWLL